MVFAREANIKPQKWSNGMSKEIEDIKVRFELSRATLMTQIFVTLAGSHGLGMAAVLSMIGRIKPPSAILPYLVVIVFMFGFGLISNLLSIVLRFEHSKLAEKQKILEVTNEVEKATLISVKRIVLMKWYKGLMYCSIVLLFMSVLVGIVGVLGTVLST